MNVAIIPARGGSKGFPGKNVALLGGLPLIQWTIASALDAALVDRVIVSTDDDAIAEASSDVEVFRRSAEAATDEATSEAALEEVLQVIDPPSIVVFLQATSPLRARGDIDATIQLVRDGFDSAFSARRVEGYTWSVGQSVTPNYSYRQRRQDQSLQRVEENGSIYAFRPYVLQSMRMRLGGDVGVHLMSPLDSLQVDTASDLRLIDTILQKREQPKWSTT